MIRRSFRLRRSTFFPWWAKKIRSYVPSSIIASMPSRARSASRRPSAVFGNQKYIGSG
jgi:hypothetical protein